MEKTGRFTQEELDKRFRDLEPPQVLEGTEYLLDIFHTLNSSRPQMVLEGAGFMPLAFTLLEMKAYSDLMDYDFEPWEIEALRTMDSGYLQESYTIISTRTKK